MEPLKLFMLLLGCRPEGRHIEQHDIFFSIGRSLSDLIPDILAFWPEAQGRIHIDGWREVTEADGYRIDIVPVNKLRNEDAPPVKRLFFINLGGYRENEFDEFHYKMISVCADKATAKQLAKQTAFYKHTGFEGAVSHIDDQFGIDVDDMHEIEEILPENIKSRYRIRLSESNSLKSDSLHLGYLKLEKINRDNK